MVNILKYWLRVTHKNIFFWWPEEILTSFREYWHQVHLKFVIARILEFAPRSPKLFS